MLPLSFDKDSLEEESSVLCIHAFDWVSTPMCSFISSKLRWQMKRAYILPNIIKVIAFI